MRLRAVAGLILLLALVLTGSTDGLRTAAEENEKQRVETLEREAYDRERFEAVRPLLPPGEVVGYREDPPENLGAHVGFVQCVLVPVVLDPDTDGPLLLVNGRPGGAPRIDVGGRRLELLHDSGNGVRLYRVGGR